MTFVFRPRRHLLGLLGIATLACSESNSPPTLHTLNVTVPITAIEVGQPDTATVAGVDQHGAAIDAGAVTWSSSATNVATVSTAGVITALTAGTVTITATSGDKTGEQTITVAAPAGIKVNEVESSGGTPGDWAELYNPTSAAVDLSGWVVKDNDDTHIYTLPAGSTIAAGGYLMVEEADLGFGLGAPDAVRLYSKYGVIVDSYSWTAHAATTYGRCPDGTGAFTTTVASTKSAANSCPGSGPTAQVWPGPGTDVVTVDAMNAFTSNLSDLIYDPGATTAQDVLWGVRNGPGTIYRLVWNGTIWTEDATNGWDAGKALHYPDGTGDPDAEGIAFAATSPDGIYVSAERNNSNNGVSRNSILLFDPSQSGTTLTATHEWNLTSDLPVTGANLGAEAVTWIPDTYLVSKSFYDEKAGHAYVPTDYPNHGTGLFFVGLEANGMIYAYALNHSDNTFNRLATISTTETGIMAVRFDRDVGYLWATCDDGCGNQASILEINTTVGSSTFGRFQVTRVYSRPSSMPNINNEGFTMAPESECSGGFKSVFWSDDSDDDGHAIRRATIPCGAFH